MANTPNYSLPSAISGFQQGFRFGRELVGDSPEDRAARAAQEAIAAKSAMADRKHGLDISKLAITQGLEAAKAQRLADHRDAQLNAQTAHWGVIEGQARDAADLANRKFTQDQYEFNAEAPYREARTSEIQGRNDARQREAEFQQESLSTGQAMQKALSGAELTDDEFKRVNKILPWYSQDAQASQKRLYTVFSQAAEKFRNGDIAGADALFSTDAGREAMASAFGPMIGNTIGSKSADGRYITKSVQPLGIFRSPDGQRLGVNLKVQRDLTDETKAELMAIANDPAKPKADRDQARSILTADHSVIAPMTEGRTPVGEGGQTRYFSPTEMQAASRTISKLAQWQRDNPEEYASVQDYVDSMMSAKNPIEANKLYLSRRDARTKAQAAAAEKALSRETSDKRALESAWTTVVKNLSPGATAYRDHPEILTREQDRVSRIAAEGAQIIREAKGPVSISEVYDRLSQKYPPNQIPADDTLDAPVPATARPEVHRVVQQMTPEQRAVGDLLRAGKIDKAEAVRRWQAMGVGR